ncbi:CD82 antigen-like [Phyllopteryx taeniolatus]|uniref:CD82 antigen-like n=1 Tax=Phycodurus eques TaxID=693459 RepID=UPI002ACEC474|nr:CD82 antigen-like [Phycodurus eques]XP_061622249.1 CD82 antigen-like [Phyllopteryx taeniolatus]
MGKGCVTATKYFLFLFNLIFFLLGAVIMGFGLWLLLDNQSFIVVLNDSIAVKAACYILIGVGTFSMLMGFLGCLGAIYEIRCLLGLYFTCLLLILIAEIVAGALIYFQKGVLNEEMSKIVSKVLDNYPGNNSTTEQAWDFIQRNMECCGWNGQGDWNGNMVIINSSQLLFPCSCHNISLATGNVSESGFCEALTPDWPVYDTGCALTVENWLLTNIGVVLGICIAIAFIELLGMILAICLCKNIHREDYTKVPKY